jgi:hypothetical protein
MNSRYLTECKRSHDEILKRWTGLLQIEPGWQYIESTSHFTDLMDKILVQLWSQSRLPARRPRPGRPSTVAMPQWDPSRCGLDMALPFLNSGKAALREVLERVDAHLTDFTDGQRGRLRWEMLLAYDTIAQRAIEQVCASCRLGGDCVYSGRTAVPGRLEGSGKPGVSR